MFKHPSFCIPQLAGLIIADLIIADLVIADLVTALCCLTHCYIQLNKNSVLNLSQFASEHLHFVHYLKSFHCVGCFAWCIVR